MGCGPRQGGHLGPHLVHAAAQHGVLFQHQGVVALDLGAGGLQLGPRRLGLGQLDAQRLLVLLQFADALDGGAIDRLEAFDPGGGLGQGGAQPALVAARAASDGVLDQMAYSRGKIGVEAQGAAPLGLPAWAEIARVVEDCRA